MNDIQEDFYYLQNTINNVGEKKILEIGEDLLKRPEKFRLTKKIIEETYPLTTIFLGFRTIEHPFWENAKKSLLSDGRSTPIKYVVCKGYANEWWVCHSLDANFTRANHLDDLRHLKRDSHEIVAFGSKLHDKEQIKRLLMFNDNVWKLYKH